MTSLISLDTETTGLDLRHGARPYFVTVCNEDGAQLCWEWDVDPLTRQVRYVEEELAEVAYLVQQADRYVLHNTKFDYGMLDHAVRDVGGIDGRQLKQLWSWDKVRDTLLAGHLLGSNLPHNLTDMSFQYLGVIIEPLEKALEEATKKCRSMIQQARLKEQRFRQGKMRKGKGGKVEYVKVPFSDWNIAEEGHPDMPSVTETAWKMDAWLPRQMAEHLGYAADHPWHTVLRDYANKDSEVTLALWLVMEREIRRRGLEELYAERLRLLPVAYHMEERGVTVSDRRLAELENEYLRDRDEATARCMDVARDYGYDLSMPRGGRNHSMDDFMLNVLELPVVKKTKKGGISLDKNVLEHFQATLPEGSPQYRFVSSLREKRSRDTAVGYMRAYRRFWLQAGAEAGWYRLHPQLNPTGTDTLRWSCQNPNEQNISKKGIDTRCPACRGEGCVACKGEGTVAYNLRYAFGPAPGREWWSLDYENLELRLPAYRAPEPAMIALFERPDEPPYYGSNHLLVAHILHPDRWEALAREVGPDKAGKEFKKRYASTWYQWVKNGNFAVQYGAVLGSGTADAAYHVPGAQAIIMSKFTGIKKLNDAQVRFAETHGYVETMPLVGLGRTKGYPLLCTRTRWNKVLATVPLSYFIQGTAMELMQGSMLRCHDQLEEWRRQSKGTWDGFITMQVHDEMVFDLPRRAHPKDDPARSNLARVRVLQQLMAAGGELIDIPTPTSVEYHPVHWGEGIAL